MFWFIWNSRLWVVEKAKNKLNFYLIVSIEESVVSNLDNQEVSIIILKDSKQTKLRERNIVITGVPETNGENCVQVVLKIGEIINYPANTK